MPMTKQQNNFEVDIYSCREWTILQYTSSSHSIVHYPLLLTPIISVNALSDKTWKLWYQVQMLEAYYDTMNAFLQKFCNILVRKYAIGTWSWLFLHRRANHYPLLEKPEKRGPLQQLFSCSHCCHAYLLSISSVISDLLCLTIISHQILKLEK